MLLLQQRGRPAPAAKRGSARGVRAAGGGGGAWYRQSAAAAPNRAAKRMHVIRQGPHFIGIADGPYIIGFENLMLARWISYTIKPDSDPVLRRTAKTDVSEEVNAGLLGMGLPSDLHVSNLTIDTDAQLVIPKTGGGPLDPMNDFGLHLDSMPYEEFLMLPLTKLVGIIMPQKILHEDPGSAVLAAQVVDPSAQYSMFKASMAAAAAAAAEEH